ncbi:MAG: hypothetical protein U0531_19550 [Dehalococcoidia bacterium]
MPFPSGWLVRRRLTRWTFVWVALLLAPTLVHAVQSAGRALERSSLVRRDEMQVCFRDICVYRVEADDEDVEEAWTPTRGRATNVRSTSTPGPQMGLPARCGSSAGRPIPAHEGTGVDSVGVWLFARGDGDLTYLGEAVYGAPRPDLAAALGDERFGRAGFTFTWKGPSPADDLDVCRVLVVGARAGGDWRTEDGRTAQATRAR